MDLPLLHKSLRYNRLVSWVQDRFFELMAVQRLLQNQHNASSLLHPVTAEKDKRAPVRVRCDRTCCESDCWYEECRGSHMEIDSRLSTHASCRAAHADDTASVAAGPNSHGCGWAVQTHSLSVLQSKRGGKVRGAVGEGTI